MEALEEAVVAFDVNDARKAHLEYKRAARDARHRGERLAAEDAQMARAYREAAKGVRIIRLSHVLALGGTQVIETEQSRYVNGRWLTQLFPVRVPNLAVCRADAAYVWTNGIETSGAWRLQFRRELGPRNTRERMAFPAGTFPASDEFPETGWQPRINALVPQPPPALRPKRSHLRNYHVLWEVEQWQIAPGPPPGDPALLKHMGGDLYAVVAVWDLTDVERAVLHGRRPGDLD